MYMLRVDNLKKVSIFVETWPFIRAVIRL